MSLLRTRLLDASRQEEAKKITAERRSQIGTVDRSEKIRTYNFPQGRVSDHRINLTLYKIDEIMLGKITPYVLVGILQALLMNFQLLLDFFLYCFGRGLIKSQLRNSIIRG